MPVAPSFQAYKIVSAEPFSKGGKLYVTVEHPSTHNHRDVRFYSDAEYQKAYCHKQPKERDDGFDGLKEARGFSRGPITVIRNNRPADLEWLKASPARYAKDVGWYFVSTLKALPSCPSHFKLLPLSWEETKGKDERHLKSAGELMTLISKKARQS